MANLEVENGSQPNCKFALKESIEVFRSVHDFCDILLCRELALSRPPEAGRQQQEEKGALGVKVSGR